MLRPDLLHADLFWKYELYENTGCNRELDDLWF
jgi:hypothetical protein